MMMMMMMMGQVGLGVVSYPSRFVPKSFRTHFYAKSDANSYIFNENRIGYETTIEGTKKLFGCKTTCPNGYEMTLYETTPIRKHYSFNGNMISACMEHFISEIFSITVLSMMKILESDIKIHFTVYE